MCLGQKLKFLGSAFFPASRFTLKRNSMPFQLLRSKKKLMVILEKVSHAKTRQKLNLVNETLISLKGLVAGCCTCQNGLNLRLWSKVEFSIVKLCIVFSYVINCESNS